MINFKISETEDYDRLVPFLIEQELEFTEEDLWEVPTDLVKCWEITAVSYTHLDVYKRQTRPQAVAQALGLGHQHGPDNLFIGQIY